MEDIFKSGLLAFTLLCTLAFASINLNEREHTGKESYEKQIQQVIVADDAAQLEKNKLRH